MHKQTQDISMNMLLQRQDIMSSIVDINNNVIFISKAMKKLNSYNAQTKSDTIKYNLKELNYKVFLSKKIVKYNYIMQSRTNKFTVYRCSKRPVYQDETTVYGTLTIQNPFKVIELNKCIDSRETVLNRIEQMILFYASLDLNPNEIYQSILQHQNQELEFVEFEQYYKTLLIKTNASRFQHFVYNNNFLKYCKILPNLLQNGLFVVKNDTNSLDLYNIASSTSRSKL